jgi:hypothetical protein
LWLAGLAAVLVCSACGPQVIEGRPPFLRISEMSTQGERLSIDFDISNENGVEMTIDAIEIRVDIGDFEVSHVDPGFRMAVDANSTEALSVEKTPSDGLRALLASLENREVISLPFDLSGRVHTLEDGFLEFNQTGHLYPVPGKPGHFRSAVTQSKELQRESPY